MSYQSDEDDYDQPDGEDELGFSDLVSDRTYIMFHGTTKKKAKAIQVNGFCRKVHGVLGHGIYLSRDPSKASCYPMNHPEHDKVIIKVEVDVGKVICIDHRGHPRRKTWHDSSWDEVYDTAWVPPQCGMLACNLEMDCVFDPDRINIIDIIKPSVLYQWPQDDFDLSPGISLLGSSAPVSGKTYFMYHGTTGKAARSIQATGFRQSEDGMLGRGVYLSRDLTKAQRYPINHPESDKVVIKVKVNVGKVIAINYKGHPRRQTWHDPKYGEVYDTAWVPPNCGMVQSGLQENCVWDPRRIEIIEIFRPRRVSAPFESPQE